MKQRHPFSGVGVVVLVFLIILWVTTLSKQNNNIQITNQEFLQEIDTGKIDSVLIRQNKETPTGEVMLLMQDGTVKQLYISDVVAVQELLLGKGIAYDLQNVPQENYLMTIILPILLSSIVLVVIFMMFNARAAGGGANAKMMNFG
ncbi:MAG: cell division protein FtsH, partial [Hungatella sp.]